MVSKFPTDLFPSPDGESQNLSLGSEGRQLRSRLVELCSVCQKPLPAASGKFTSHIRCTCATPTNTAVPEYNTDASPKKKKVETDLGAGEPSSKRQLFKDSISSGEQIATAERRTPVTEHSEPLSSTSTGGRRSTKLKSEAGASKKPNTVGKSRHLCSICSKCFNTPGKLNQHMYSHTGEKPFVCSHCSKAFSSKFKLVRHILIHSDLRQYRCTVCDRTFHRKDHLKNHSKVHSPVKRRFKCDRAECSKEYSSILSYRKHIAVHSAEEGNLECKICGKKFETKEDTLFHLKVHAGSRSLKTPADRKYHCDHCDRSFFTGKDVRRHLVVHTGRRDFLCQYCPQRFGRKDHLTRHIKKSHSSSTKKAKSKKTEDTCKSKPVENVLLEMLDSKMQQVKFMSAVAATSQQSTSEAPQPPPLTDESVYKIAPHLNSPADVLKLESSPDILSIVTIDEKTSIPPKVDESMGIYNILDPNIPYKYENFEFENYSYEGEDTELPMPGTSGSTQTAILPELIYQQPPPPYPTELPPFSTSAPVKEEFPSSDRSSSLNLILPPITNISPSISSMGTCMMSNSDFQHLLSGTEATSAASTDPDANNENSRLAEQLLNFIPNSSELLASLLSSTDPQTNSAPLPGFSQAFHQPP